MKQSLMFGVLAITLIGMTFTDILSVAAEEEDIAYVICAKDGKENKVPRELGKKEIICSEGHVLTEILCAREFIYYKEGEQPRKTVNKLRNDEGKLNTQCYKCYGSVIILPQDKGPNKIEESVLKTYSEKMQKRYRLLSERCSECHPLARPLNAGFSTKEWQKYVKRMIRRPGFGPDERDGMSEEERDKINNKEGKEIYHFLKFYEGKKKK